MDKLRNYDIEFSGLKVGKHEFNFEINKAFFELFDTELEFSDPEIFVIVGLHKHGTFLEFWFEIQGVIQLNCDITNELFSHTIENETKVLVKFGEEYDDSHEEVITIPHTNHFFNIAQLVYELVILSVPMKKISPYVKPKDLELLDKFSPKEQEQIEEQEINDPRWEALKNIKNKN